MECREQDTIKAISNTPGARFDHAYYWEKHMQLIKARLGDVCKRRLVPKTVLTRAEILSKIRLSRPCPKPPIALTKSSTVDSPWT
jgi:hypothetical protein